MMKLTTNQKEEICIRYQNGENSTELAYYFGVYHSTILRTLERRGIQKRKTIDIIKSRFMDESGNCKKCNTNERYADGRCKHCTNKRNREWYDDNIEKQRQRSLTWAHNNRSKKSAQHHKYCADKMGGGGSFTSDEWINLCKQYNYRCACCGKKKKLTRDHIIPVSRGGSSNINNIQPLCTSCNSRKRDKTIFYNINQIKH